MLVLSRKVNETIKIGTDIIITVVRLEPNKVRLGIEAPMELDINRDDMKNHKKAKKRVNPNG